MIYCKVKGCRFKYTHNTASHICGTCKSRGHDQVECNCQFLKNQLINYHNEKFDENHSCCVLTCKCRDCHTIEGHFCNICKQGFHNDYVCKFVMIEPKESFDYHFNNWCKNVKYLLPNRQNWILNTDCLDLIENILKDKYIKELYESIIKCFYSYTKNEDNYSDSSFDLVRNEYNSNYDFEGEDKNIYFEVYAGMGCVIAVRIDRWYYPLSSFFLHSDFHGQYGEHTNHIKYFQNFINGYKKIDKDLIGLY